MIFQSIFNNNRDILYLDEEAWTATQPIILGMLEKSAETSPHSELHLFHKDNILYISAHLIEPNMGRLKREVTKNDGPAHEDDSVEIFLSPFPKHGYYQFIVSATGAIYDRHDHGNPASFNAGAKAAVRIAENSWTLEIAIPKGSLGVSGKIPTQWRANFYRNRHAGTDGPPPRDH